MEKYHQLYAQTFRSLSDAGLSEDASHEIALARVLHRVVYNPMHGASVSYNGPVYVPSL